MHKSGCHKQKNSKIWDNYNYGCHNHIACCSKERKARGFGNYIILILDHNKICLSQKLAHTPLFYAIVKF